MISYISSAVADSNSISSMPTHIAGDLLLFFAFDDSGGGMVVPAGKTTIYNTGNYAAGYMIASSGGEASGTWTNADHVLVAVYRGTKKSGPIGAKSVNTTGTSTCNFSSLTLQNADGSSWVSRGGFSIDSDYVATSYNIETPSGFTTRAGDGTDPAFAREIFDTNGGVTSCAAATPSLGGYIADIAIGISIELLAARDGALFWAFP